MEVYFRSPITGAFSEGWVCSKGYNSAGMNTGPVACSDVPLSLASGYERGDTLISATFGSFVFTPDTLGGGNVVAGLGNNVCIYVEVNEFVKWTGRPPSFNFQQPSAACLSTSANGYTNRNRPLDGTL